MNAAMAAWGESIEGWLGAPGIVGGDTIRPTLIWRCQFRGERTAVRRMVRSTTRTIPRGW